MTGKCLLETDGAQMTFDLKRLMAKNYADLVVEFTLSRSLGRFSIRSIPTFIAISDLQRLIDYLEQHIARLRVDPDSESETFVPTELGFQLQALAGDLFDESDGEFTLRLMLNVGRSHDAGASVYMGGETVVTLPNVKKFITSLQMALSESSLFPVTPFGVNGPGPSKLSAPNLVHTPRYQTATPST